MHAYYNILVISNSKTQLFHKNYMWMLYEHCLTVVNT